MATPLKTFSISRVRDRGGAAITLTGTVAELTQKFSYTLECGASYQHEKGNKKINRTPKGIKSLISNLNNAVNNSAANGYASEHFVMVVASAGVAHAD